MLKIDILDESTIMILCEFERLSIFYRQKWQMNLEELDDIRYYLLRQHVEYAKTFLRNNNESTYKAFEEKIERTFT